MAAGAHLSARRSASGCRLHGNAVPERIGGFAEAAGPLGDGHRGEPLLLRRNERAAFVLAVPSFDRLAVFVEHDAFS